MEMVRDVNEGTLKIPKELATAMEQAGLTTEPVDPIVTDDDKKLLDKARRSVANLQIEIKTVIGFTSDYLAEKYNIKDQEQFNRLFGNF